MYRPEYYFLNGGNTLDRETLNWGKNEAMAGTTQNVVNLRKSQIEKPQSGRHCTYICNRHNISDIKLQQNLQDLKHVYV